MIFFSKAIKETSKQVLRADHGDDVTDDFKTLRAIAGCKTTSFSFSPPKRKRCYRYIAYSL
jgi:hypothetical protein